MHARTRARMHACIQICVLSMNILRTRLHRSRCSNEAVCSTSRYQIRVCAPARVAGSIPIDLCERRMHDDCSGALFSRKRSLHPFGVPGMRECYRLSGFSFQRFHRSAYVPLIPVEHYLLKQSLDGRNDVSTAKENTECAQKERGAAVVAQRAERRLDARPKMSGTRAPASELLPWATELELRHRKTPPMPCT